MKIMLDRLRPRYFKVGPNSEIWNNQLTIEPGVHLIMAPSGRGKSSLLKQLCGVETTCDGQSWLEPSAQPAYPRNFAYMEQQLRAVPSFRVHQLLQLGLPNQTVAAGLIEDRLAQVGLANFQDRLCQNLSRGELQRVLFVRALLQAAAWLALDEPWAHVDPENTRRMVDLVLTEVSGGRGALITSLDPAEEALFAHRPSEITFKIWRLA